MRQRRFAHAPGSGQSAPTRACRALHCCRLSGDACLCVLLFPVDAIKRTDFQRPDRPLVDARRSHAKPVGVRSRDIEGRDAAPFAKQMPGCVRPECVLRKCRRGCICQQPEAIGRHHDVNVFPHGAYRTVAIPRLKVRPAAELEPNVSTMAAAAVQDETFPTLR